ncbi:MAG: ubiH [Gammaproteobacteria bacterium]|nr:ubiH [Gammaproteobacteria bacterium]
MESSSSIDTDIFDILLVGGGIVGNVLSLALAGQPLRIGIIEAQSSPATSQAIQHHRDERAIALTNASVRLFQSLGVWDAIAPYATAIQQVHVSEAGRFGQVKLRASDTGYAFLGQVVSAHRLLEALRARVSQFSNITTLYETKLEQLERNKEGYTLKLHSLDQAQYLNTRLVVAADGTQSFTRKCLNIPIKSNDYHQHAIVATLQVSHPHNGVAYERFTTSGALGALPLLGDRYVVVWTIPSNQLEDLMALSAQDFCKKLQHLWGYKLGRILSIEKRQSFLLQSVFATQQTAPFALLIGNAAHTLHPVAAQGLNLSLKDVAVFAEMVSEAIANQQDPTRYALLETYAQSRKREQVLTSVLTNTLIHLFSYEIAPLVWGRNIGLSSFNLLPTLQRIFAKRAMGLSGRLPALMRY